MQMAFFRNQEVDLFLFFVDCTRPALHLSRGVQMGLIAWPMARQHWHSDISQVAHPMECQFMGSRHEENGVKRRSTL
jgi:hypothetical protein